MYGQHFYNETTRRYVAVFGTLFNDIKITRSDSNGTPIQSTIVPIHYAPMQKILARLEQDPDLNAQAMTLPRMSFEITSMSYDPERKVPSINTITKDQTTRYTPAPYNLEFQLNIMAKYNEDGTKIIEQILPYFKPDIAPSVKILDDMDTYIDVPIVLNSVSTDDIYEGDFESRRAITYTLNFTMKAFYFGPTINKKKIKFVEATLTDETKNVIETVTVQPGLDENGEPTTDPTQSVNFATIDEDDNWAYIVEIEDGN